MSSARSTCSQHAGCLSLPHIREVTTVHRNNFKSSFLHCIKCRCSALFTLFLLVTVLVLSSSSNVYATDDYDYDYDTYSDTDSSDSGITNTALTGTNNSTGYEYILDDSADFIDDALEDNLISSLKDTTKYCNVAVVTTTSHPYTSTETFAVNTFESYFGNGSNGVIFVIDRDLNEIYLASEGTTRRTISNSKCDSICDNTYIYATSSHDYDYYTCCMETIDQVNTVLSGGRISQPLRYISSIFIALAIGIIFCFMYAIALSRGRKAKNRELMNAAFTKVDVHNARTRFVNQTRVYSPQSSGNSHSGGGHSGGGHSSGGHSGGGHHI